MSATNPQEFGTTARRAGEQPAPAGATRMRILTPLDGSALAESVLPHAVALARALNMDLRLLRLVQYQAILSPLIWTQTTSDVIEQMCEQARLEAETYLETTSAHLEALGVGVTTAVQEAPGPVADALCQAAADPTVALIAMATHGRSGLGRWLLGSVADETLHAAPVPLLVVHPAGGQAGLPGLAAPAYRTLIVPLDGSPLAEQALPWVERIATQAGTDALLLSVLQPPEPTGLLHSAADQSEAKGRAEQGAHAEDYLRTIVDRLGAAGVHATPRVARGQPALEIVRQAEETRGALVVMGTHGRGGLSRARLGSVATKVVQATHAPVLLVREKLT